MSRRVQVLPHFVVKEEEAAAEQAEAGGQAAAL